jgi:hypothetical protein
MISKVFESLIKLVVYSFLLFVPVGIMLAVLGALILIWRAVMVSS